MGWGRLGWPRPNLQSVLYSQRLGTEPYARQTGMTAFQSQFWEAASFTGAAVVFVFASSWWLYFSPLRAPAGRPMAVSPRLAAGLAALLGLWALFLVAGAFWDASMHIRTGQIPAGADFLWPPHLMIYGGFLMSFTVAMIAIGRVAQNGWLAGDNDPRQWVRGNPYLGAVALASLYSLLSIPGDALWHALYGVDLTAWSPPHLILGLMSCTVMVCALGLLAQSRPAFRRPERVSGGMIGLLSLMLSVAYMIGVIEWEMPGALDGLVAARPIWFYPLVGGAIAFFTLLLAKRLTGWRWAASLTALGFYALRAAIAAGLALTGNIVPHVPLVFLLGAVAMDLVPAEQIKPAIWREVALAAAFTLGYGLLALPALAQRAGLPALGGADVLLGAVGTLVATALLAPAARAVAARLLGRAQPSPAPAV